jgi:3-oxoacyl-[acyl-carrier protein] reductase
MGLGTLDQKVALVTGGSSDIGRAISLALAEAGADVVVNYYSNEEGARSCVAKIEALGRHGLAHQADTTKLAAIDAMVDATVARFGRLDILVNGVGIVTRKKKLADWTEADWDFIVDATLKGSFFTSQRAAKVMKEQKWGRIINISTTAAKLANELYAPYITAKGGVDAMTLALALELAPHGITVNAVRPPIVPVERNRSRWDFYQEQVVPFIPMGRLCRPEDIGAAVVLFASPEAEYITGQIIAVDGGWTSRPAYPLP